MRALLVNPWVYDFKAFDFWNKPVGLLIVANILKTLGFEIDFIDCMDRLSPYYKTKTKTDVYGRGKYHHEVVEKPEIFKIVPRCYKRYGIPRECFLKVIKKLPRPDIVFVTSSMTYWYLGVFEVIKILKEVFPKTKIILGGIYATICQKHAEKYSGADIIFTGPSEAHLIDLLADLGHPTTTELNPGRTTPDFSLYKKLHYGIILTSRGCPFNCTYCCAPRLYGGFKPRPLGRSVAELELLVQRGVRNIAFYDDALLFEADKVLVPFLEEVLSRNIKVNFHTPNALGARFMTRELAELMVRVGFRTFYIGFESKSAHFQERTGSKVRSEELAEAVEHLTCTGAERTSITAYHMLGHPGYDIQQLDESMRFVNRLGIRGMLADFSPIPGTVDGEYCRKWVDMDEPLMHNKTAFAIILLGFEEVNRIKELQRRLNRSLSSA